MKGAKTHMILKDLTIPCGASSRNLLTSFLPKLVTCPECLKRGKKK